MIDKLNLSEATLLALQGQLTESKLDEAKWKAVIGDKVLAPGDKIKDFRGDEHEFAGVTPPGSMFGGMNGKIQVKSGDSYREYYPSVFNAKIVQDKEECNQVITEAEDSDNWEIYTWNYSDDNPELIEGAGYVDGQEFAFTLNLFDNLIDFNDFEDGHTLDVENKELINAILNLPFENLEESKAWIKRKSDGLEKTKSEVKDAYKQWLDDNGWTSEEYSFNDYLRDLDETQEWELIESKEVDQLNFTEAQYKKFCKYWVSVNLTGDAIIPPDGKETGIAVIYYANENDDYGDEFKSFKEMFDAYDIGEGILNDYEDKSPELKEYGITEKEIRELDRVYKYDLFESKNKSEENPQEFEYKMLSRLKSDCDYYLGNGNRDAEHCLWAKNEQGQIEEMRRIYNQLKEKPEWLSEEDINNYAKEMGVVDLPSTTDGTAGKEIQDMLDRSEKRSKELNEEMNGLMSTNSNAEQLYNDFIDFEGELFKDNNFNWNEASKEERESMARSAVIKFYKANRSKVDDNWNDFMELLEYWNYHTEYKIFNDLAYDDILYVEESKKVTEELEENSKFDSIEFENKIPRVMRWKHNEHVNDNDLYWVTQEFFNEDDVKAFAEEFKNTGFDKAYVTVRDLSTYDFNDDSKHNVFVIVNKDGSYDMSGYLKNCKDTGYDGSLFEAKDTAKSLTEKDFAKFCLWYIDNIRDKTIKVDKADYSSYKDMFDSLEIGEAIVPAWEDSDEDEREEMFETDKYTITEKDMEKLCKYLGWELYEESKKVKTESKEYLIQGAPENKIKYNNLDDLMFLADAVVESIREQGLDEDEICEYLADEGRTVTDEDQNGNTYLITDGENEHYVAVENEDDMLLLIDSLINKYLENGDMDNLISDIESNDYGFEVITESKETKTKKVTESLEENDEDGWGDEVSEILEPCFQQVEQMAYEIRNCVRGSYAGFGDTVEELASAVEEIKDMFEDAYSELSDMQEQLQESKKQSNKNPYLEAFNKRNTQN